MNENGRVGDSLPFRRLIKKNPLFSSDHVGHIVAHEILCLLSKAQSSVYQKNMRTVIDSMSM
jgi:hypothetical protein